MPGITLYMQPVQDLTIEDRVSRTQFQFTLERPTRTMLHEWVPQLVERLQRAARSSPTSRATCRTTACRPIVEIDRDAASRLGVTRRGDRRRALRRVRPAPDLDIFTQANQYRVVLEVDAASSSGPEALDEHLRRRRDRRTQVPLSSIARVERAADAALSINHVGQFPAATMSFNLAPGASLGEAVDGDRDGAARARHAGQHRRRASRARREAFRASLDSTLLLILAAIVTMYIVLGVLYESYIHPITILSTLPSAGVGALLALLLIGTRPRA